jgi:hypothetical protein
MMNTIAMRLRTHTAGGTKFKGVKISHKSFRRHAKKKGGFMDLLRGKRIGIIFSKK